MIELELFEGHFYFGIGFVPVRSVLEILEKVSHDVSSCELNGVEKTRNFLLVTHLLF